MVQQLRTKVVRFTYSDRLPSRLLQMLDPRSRHLHRQRQLHRQLHRHVHPHVHRQVNQRMLQPHLLARKGNPSKPSVPQMNARNILVLTPTRLRFASNTILVRWMARRNQIATCFAYPPTSYQILLSCAFPQLPHKF